MGGMPVYMGAPVQQGMGGSEASSSQRFVHGGGKYGSYGHRQQSAESSDNFYQGGRRTSSASFAAYPAYSPPMGMPMTAYSPSWYSSHTTRSLPLAAVVEV